MKSNTRDKSVRPEINALWSNERLILRETQRAVTPFGGLAVFLRERVREDRDSVGRKLIDVPGYTFRVFVTSGADAPEELWRDYNRRADMENRLADLKHDLGADGFCLKQFLATQAAFRAVLLLFNLLAEFQRAAGLPGYREPAAIRTQVLTCAAVLGRAGRRLVVHLSQSWGGLKTSNPLRDSILNWQIPTGSEQEFPCMRFFEIDTNLRRRRSISKASRTWRMRSSYGSPMLAGGHPLPGNLSRTAPKPKGLYTYFVRVGSLECCRSARTAK